MPPLPLPDKHILNSVLSLRKRDAIPLDRMELQARYDFPSPWCAERRFVDSSRVRFEDFCGGFDPVEYVTRRTGESRVFPTVVGEVEDGEGHGDEAEDGEKEERTRTIYVTRRWSEGDHSATHRLEHCKCNERSVTTAISGDGGIAPCPTPRRFALWSRQCAMVYLLIQNTSPVYVPSEVVQRAASDGRRASGTVTRAGP